MSAADSTPPDADPPDANPTDGDSPPKRRRYRAPARKRAPRKVGHVYSRLVRVLRTVLPLAALALMAVLLAWPSLRDDEPPPSAADPSQPTGEARVLNPRYYATDDQNRPYSVTAQSAWGLADSDEVLDLDRPYAEMTLETGEGLTLGADQGRYQRAADRLDLIGAVWLRRDDGYIIRTELVHVDLLEQRAWGDRPVEMTGPQADMWATGFEIEEGGDIVILHGPATLILRPASETPDP